MTSTPLVTLFSQPLCLERHSKVLGLNCDWTHTKHNNNVNTKTAHKLIVLNALSSTTFWQQKESLYAIYKQLKSIDYVSPGWASKVLAVTRAILHGKGSSYTKEMNCLSDTNLFIKLNNLTPYHTLTQGLYQYYLGANRHIDTSLASITNDNFTVL